MSGFSILTSHAVPIDRANVDTDQIIPKQFLTAVTREGFGKHLFHDWRYLDKHEQQPDPEFPLNRPEHQQAKILVARENFGCGSSREHAPWALKDWGIEVIIATSLADIFYGNCLNNQMLAIQLPDKEIAQLLADMAVEPGLEVTVDLPEQRVSWADHSVSFVLNPEHKANLIEGLDSIGQTLLYAQQIDSFEQSLPSYRL